MCSAVRDWVQLTAYESDSFDVTVSFTVMQEVDADHMMSELVRVTRPGGRIRVVIRRPICQGS